MIRHDLHMVSISWMQMIWNHDRDFYRIVQLLSSNGPFHCWAQFHYTDTLTIKIIGHEKDGPTPHQSTQS